MPDLSPIPENVHPDLAFPDRSLLNLPFSDRPFLSGSRLENYLTHIKRTLALLTVFHAASPFPEPGLDEAIIADCQAALRELAETAWTSVDELEHALPGDVQNLSIRSQFTRPCSSAEARAFREAMQQLDASAKTDGGAR